MVKKYKTLEALSEAINKKEIRGIMYIDNDDVYFVADEESDRAEAAGACQPEDSETSYDGGCPIEVLREALDTLGIIWEDV